MDIKSPVTTLAQRCAWTIGANAWPLRGGPMHKNSGRINIKGAECQANRPWRVSAKQTRGARPPVTSEEVKPVFSPAGSSTSRIRAMSEHGEGTDIYIYIYMMQGCHTPPTPPHPLRCNLGVYPLARRTGTQTHRSLLFLQAHGCSQYSARTLSNRHRYMQVIRETVNAPGCVTSVFQPGTNLKTRRTA